MVIQEEQELSPDVEINKLVQEGRFNLSQFELELATDKALLLVDIGKKYNKPDGIIRGLILQGSVDVTLRNYDSGFVKYHKALKLAESIDNKKLISVVYVHLGRWYSEMGDLEKAKELLLKVLEYFPEDISAMNNLAISYARSSSQEKALEYFEKRYRIVLDKNLQNELSVSASNIGVCLSSLNRFDESLEKFNEALTYAFKFENNRKLCNIYNSITKVYINKGMYEKALEYCKQAQPLAEEVQDLEELERVYGQLYEVHRYLGNNIKAYDSVDKCRIAQRERYQISLSGKIKNLESVLTHERKVRDRKEKALQQSNESFKLKLAHYQSAYKELFGIGEVGVFSDKIKNVLDIAYFFHNDRNVSVLIEGETGTGKEIIARVVHFGKEGDTRPFIIINCSAISPGLFESELFGYEEGAFTGARVGGMIGKLEMAQGGTLFLDEIGEMPVELQAKLLRVIQQKEFYRIGGQVSIKLDVRIICATNRDLKLEMEEKRFRSDLFYRLTTGRIFIPPLRERKEEIAPLAQMFLMQFAKEKKRKFQYIENDALHFMEEYDWPGNIRELQNTIERIILLHDDNSIKNEYLSFVTGNSADCDQEDPFALQIELPEEGINIKDIQRMVMRKILNKFDGNKSRAADYLKMSRKTFYKHDM